MGQYAVEVGRPVRRVRHPGGQPVELSPVDGREGIDEQVGQGADITGTCHLVL
jgi:hypothetical protein